MERARPEVRLQAFEVDRDADRLLAWLAQPHVARWWGDAGRAMRHARECAPESHALIVADEAPVGYLCWGRLSAEELAEADLGGLAGGLVDVDILIGEPALVGRGVGSRALELLLERLREDPSVSLAGLGTSASNAHAIRCFEKAGFRLHREFQDPEWGACKYLVADVRGASGEAVRRIVLVSGMPGSGKTTLATGLAGALGFTLVSKDYIKETLFDALVSRSGDLTVSRQLGGAAMEVLWTVAAHARDVVLEANLRPHSAYERAKLAGLGARIVEVFCECTREEAARRFSARAERGVHPAHALAALPDSLLDEYDGPVGIASVIRVNTMEAVDTVALARQVRQEFANLVVAHRGVQGQDQGPD